MKEEQQKDPILGLVYKYVTASGEAKNICNRQIEIQGCKEISFTV